MEKPNWAGPLAAAYQQALAFLSDLPERRVGPAVGPEQLRAALDDPLPEFGSDPREVIDALAGVVDPGLMASSGGRFFGFVIGMRRRFAAALARRPGVEVLNDVVLNQVLVRFPADDDDHDGRTLRVIGRVQDLGICWMVGTSWRGQAAMRISVSNWSTDEQDIAMAVDPILRCAAAERREVAAGGRGRIHEHIERAGHP